VRSSSGSRKETQWTPRFFISTVGLAALAIAVLFSAAALDGWARALPAVLFAVPGLLLAFIGVQRWWSTRWLRKVIKAERRGGKAAWPIRARSDAGGWSRVGMLAVDAQGLQITVADGSVTAAWPELDEIRIEEEGVLSWKSIVLSGPRAGRLKVDVLEANAVVRTDVVSLEGCARQLEAIRKSSTSR